MKSLYKALCMFFRFHHSKEQEATRSNKHYVLSTFLATLMATAVVSKATLSKCFSNKSFVLSVHRLQHSKKQSRNDELQQIFRHLDANGNGKIEGSEIRSYLASKREFMSPEEAQAVTNELDAAGGDSLVLSFDDFAMLMERQGGDDDLKRGFQMFAGKRSGSITSEDLQRTNKLSNEECKSIIKAFDLNGDGVIDFPEFQQMMA
ncbi:probable calcium-binding protein CML41 [Telopea speciosissima]|uniref:probable calcium-binding protein CML41 n=1 Tax=Telopea speciosissima TaxID=54955 RepID=UPI001CC44A7A|nr:probable calcium-binding protein CML41 [Telopea speciosissima]